MKGETGFVCETVNSIVQRLKCLPYPIALLVALLSLLTAPLLAIAPLIIIGIPTLIVFYFSTVRNIRGSPKIFYRALWVVVLLILIAPSVALISAGYTVFLALYYLLIPILVVIMLLRIVFYNCYKPKQSVKNKERLEK